MKETTRAAFTKLTPQFQHQRMSLSLRLVFLPTLTLSGEILTPNSSLSLSLSLSLSAKRIKRVYSFSAFATQRDAFHIIYSSLLPLHFP